MMKPWREATSGTRLLATRRQTVARYLLNQPTQEQRDQSDGRKAKIIKDLPADAYKVKVADGSIRFFSGKGLEKDK